VRAAGKSGLHPQVMIDFSHANSSKQHRRQIDVSADVAQQIAGGDARITGVMIESHIHEGRQDIVEGQELPTASRSPTPASAWSRPCPCCSSWPPPCVRRAHQA
jgi:phospho-2-dehydro-3-deoxyheptonate aldolase